MGLTIIFINNAKTNQYGLVDYGLDDVKAVATKLACKFGESALAPANEAPDFQFYTAPKAASRFTAQAFANVFKFEALKTHFLTSSQQDARDPIEGALLQDLYRETNYEVLEEELLSASADDGFFDPGLFEIPAEIKTMFWFADQEVIRSYTNFLASTEFNLCHGEAVALSFDAERWAEIGEETLAQDRIFTPRF